MKRWFHLTAAVVVCAVCTAVGASAQLGEVARKEAERRKTVTSSGKTYTNESLKSEPQPASAPASSGTEASTSTSAPPPSSSSTPPPPRVSADPEERKKDEAQWRERIRREREALERAKTFADALQSRINALDTDFVNRDDPAQRSVIAADRDKALAELERVKKEIEQHTKAIATIQEEARRAGVPAGWIR
jgi:hypothetical protein